MYTEKQLLKFSLSTERAHRLALDMAILSAELAEYGKSMAIVADETRNVGKKLQLFLDEDNVNESAILDALLQIKFLAVNGCLEMLRIHESRQPTKRKLAVIFDEIRNIADDIETAFNIKQELPLVLPRVSEKSSIIADSIIWDSALRFVLFEIGGMQFCEATTNVNEVYLYPVSQLSENTVKIRGQELELINCYNKLSLEMPKKDFLPLIRITGNYQKTPKDYALVIDGIPDVFFASIGLNTIPKNIPAEFVRECWNCEEDGQMIFIKYEALS